MAATPSRQAWQLMRNSSRVPAANLLRQQQQPLRSAFSRHASSTTQSSSRRAVTQSPSSFLRQQPLAQRSYSSGGSQGQNTPPKNSGSPFKVWPFVVILALGSGGYMLLSNQRKSELPLHTYSRRMIRGEK